jgi:large subunit ribosomal protein L25
MEKPKIIELKAVERTVDSKHLTEVRGQELVPSVLYGPAMKENIHFSVDRIALEKILSVKSLQYINLVFEDGKKIDAIVKTTQFHPVTDRPLHVDFYALDEKVPVTVTIPIRLTGTSPGVIEGGRLYQSLRKLSVKALPGKIPAELTLDISKLQIGHNLKVRTLKLNGIQPLMSPDRTILVIRPPRDGKAKIEEFSDEEEAAAAEAGSEAEATSAEENS